MVYQYKETDGVNEIKFKNNGTWKYVPSKLFINTEKDDDSVIFGDVTGVKAEKSLRYVSMDQAEKKYTLRIFRYKSRLTFFDKVIGYISVLNPNGQSGYVRIRKKSVKKILLSVLLLFLMLAGGYTALNYNQGPNLDENAIAYQLPDGVKNTDPNSILLPGYDILEMDSKTQKVDAALLNPEGNECYFKFSIILKSNQSELYQTGLIKPGTAITSFKINQKLKKGKYPIIIKVEATDIKDTDMHYNGGAIEAVLEVK